MVLLDWTLIKIKFFHEAFLNELFTDNYKKELLYICQYMQQVLLFSTKNKDEV